MDGGQKVWAPHPVEGYQLGTIVDVGADTLTVQPLQASEQVSIASAAVSYSCLLQGGIVYVWGSVSKLTPAGHNKGSLTPGACGLLSVLHSVYISSLFTRTVILDQPRSLACP